MIDRDIAAKTAKMTIVGKGTNQTEIAKRLGIERIFLNSFLNRRIDLLPQEIERLLKELGIFESVIRLSKQKAVAE
jgi:transcriptional regulator with XRE-family HTH domain